MTDNATAAAAPPGARTLRDIAGLARLANCGTCWQKPGHPCAIAGDHLGRYIRAERRGLISRADLTAVTATLDVIAVHVIVPEVTP